MRILDKLLDSVKYLLKMLLVSMVTCGYLVCVGFAASDVQEKFKYHPNVSSYLDLSKIEKCEYQGQEPKYSELIQIHNGLTNITANRTYARLLFTADNKTEYVLLIPIDNQPYSTSIWRRPDKNKVLVTLNKPVEVVFNPPVEKGIKNIMSLLPPESWQGYSSKVVVYNEKNEERIYIAYRNGSGNDDIYWSITDATDLHIKSGQVGRSEAAEPPYLLQALAMSAAYSKSHRKDKCDPHSYYYSVAFSPDGQYALSGSYDNAVKIWDIKSGDKIRVLLGHTDAVVTVAFSPDGRYILSGSRDYTMKLWDFNSGLLIKTFIGHKKYYSVSSVAFTPDGSHALSGSGDGTMKLWVTESGRELRTIEKPRRCCIGTPGINAIAISPNGRSVASASSDEEVNLWDIYSGQNIKKLLGHSKTYVETVAFSPNGEYVLSGGNDGTIKLWEVTSGWEIRSFKQNAGYVYSVAFSPDGRYIISGNENGCILLWELATGRLIRTFGEHSGIVSSVAFSPDGHFILSGSNDETLKLWEIESGKEIRILKAEPEKVPSKCK